MVRYKTVHEEMRVSQQGSANLYQYNKGKSALKNKTPYPIAVRYALMLIIEDSKNGIGPVEMMYNIQDKTGIPFVTLRNWYYYRKDKIKEQYYKKHGKIHPVNVIEGNTDVEKFILEYFNATKDVLSEGAKGMENNLIDGVDGEDDGIRLRLVAEGQEIPIIIAEVNELRDMLDSLKEELDKSLKEIKSLKRKLKNQDGKEKVLIDAIEAERRLIAEKRKAIAETLQEIAGKVKVKAGLYIKEDSDPEFLKLVERMDVFLHVLEKKIPNVRQLWIDIMTSDDIGEYLIEDYMDSDYFIPPEKDYMEYWREVQQMFMDIDDAEEVERVERGRGERGEQ